MLFSVTERMRSRTIERFIEVIDLEPEPGGVDHEHVCMSTMISSLCI
jgi:hypothetical protein